MGSSPSAHIFFGVYLGEEGSWHNDSEYAELPQIVTDEGMDDLVVALTAPYLKRPAGRYDSNNPEWDAYFKARKEALALCPVSLYVGSYMGEYPCSCLGIKASHTWAHTYAPTSMDKAPIRSTGRGPRRSRWVEQLKKWAEHLGLPWEKIEAANPDGPQWMIILNYG